MLAKEPVLICDLDNTLYDWVGFFVPAIYGLIEEAARLLNCDDQRVIDDLREVHQKYHDSEHPFALLETKIVRERFAGCSRLEAMNALDPAFHAFNSVRARELRLYDSVLETIQTLHESGVRLLAHTESKYFSAVDRVCRLGLEPYFERIYCREEAAIGHPDAESGRRWQRQVPAAKIVKLPVADVKPSVRVLQDICRAENVDVRHVVYVGDSLSRDVMMAKHGGAFAVWAAYGSRHSPELYEKLVRITHWTAEDVDREKRIRDQAKSVQPDFVCQEKFSELEVGLQIFMKRNSSKFALH